MTININLDDTPDEMPVVSAGEHVLEVLDIEEQEDKQGDPVHVVALQVNEPGEPDHERKCWNRFNFKYEIARIMFKQFVLSCGGDASGSEIDPSELIGCTCRARFGSRTYQDADGETVETTQIKKFFHSVTA